MIFLAKPNFKPNRHIKEFFMLHSLKVQIYLLVFIPFIFIASVGLYSQIASTDALQVKVGEVTRAHLITIEKKRLTSIVETANSILQPYLAMPGKTGLKDALSLLNTIRYDDGVGTIFTYDTEGIRLQSSTGKGIGKSFWNSKDKKGNLIVQNIITAAKNGTGFTTYYFVKTGDTDASPKYSYSLLVPQWDIIISTGFYIEDVDKISKQTDSEVMSVVDGAVADSVMLFCIAFVIVALVVFIAINRLYRPLNELSTSVKALASGEGDLTKTLPTSHISLLNKISNDFNLFISEMGVDIKGLKETSGKLNTIAHLSSEQQVRLEALSNDQKNQTEQVATAIEQMSSTSNEIANTAEHTRESATAVEKEMKNVLQQVQVSYDQIESLNTLMSGVKGSITELGNNVNLISSVLSVIEGLSEQTNLLALNAAIEAARAGEQGRGFAVVADEVRTLAKRSQDSTIEIKEILEKLQSSADKTVQDMSRSDHQRGVVTSAMERIREIISGSNDAIQRLSEMNVQVSTAASEQSTVSAEISERINGIASLADDIGNSSTEARGQFSSLEKQSKLIADMTKKFTV